MRAVCVSAADSARPHVRASASYVKSAFGRIDRAEGQPGVALRPTAAGRITSRGAPFDAAIKVTKTERRFASNTTPAVELSERRRQAARLDVAIRASRAQGPRWSRLADRVSSWPCWVYEPSRRPVSASRSCMLRNISDPWARPSRSSRFPATTPSRPRRRTVSASSALSRPCARSLM
jgi:hypothetical protein